MKRLNATAKAEISKLYRAGYPVRVIADMYDITEAKVVALLGL